MKALIYYPIFRDVNTYTSVNKKFTEIQKAFANSKIELDVVSYKKKGIYFNDKCIKIFPENKYFRRLVHMLSFAAINKEIANNQYDFIWIRAGFVNPGFFSFLKTAKKISKKVILEYGTFPFIKEVPNLFEKMWVVTDFIYRKKLKNVVDYVITYCGQDLIYGIKCLNIGNGIDSTFIDLKTQTKAAHEINLAMVSSMFYWHGIDRIIKGMADYYNSKNQKQIVNLFVVGEGAEKENLQKLVADNNLTNYVTFYGEKRGAELINIYHQSHIGVGALAVHRKNIVEESTLKAREYAAFGLPLILAAKDRDFENGIYFLNKVNLDDSNIDVEKIVFFYNNLKETKPDFQSEIKKYTAENLTWEAKISKIIKNISI